MDKSTLASLPGELRNRIYTEVLVEDKGIPVYTSHEPDANSHWQAPALLQVCRQIRDEASSIYYGLNVFRFAYPATLPDYLSAEKRAAMHELSMFGEGCTMKLAEWLSVLGWKTSGLLREMHLEEMTYDIERINGEVRSCKEFLGEMELPILESKIFLELVTDGGDRTWVNSAFHPIVECMPRKERRDDFLADYETAWWKWP